MTGDRGDAAVPGQGDADGDQGLGAALLPVALEGGLGELRTLQGRAHGDPAEPSPGGGGHPGPP